MSHVHPLPLASGLGMAAHGSERRLGLVASGAEEMRSVHAAKAVSHEAGGLIITLTNGQREKVDVLVGADGLHSRVRCSAMLPPAPSLLAGEGTGLAMLEAYVLAGEFDRSGGEVSRALGSYEARLRRFVGAKQKAAVRFRGFFVPRTALGLAVRNLAVRAFALPFVGTALAGGALRDEFVLPEYEHGGSMRGGRPPS